MYKGAQSTMKLLPGGGPQGAFLGGIIFMLKFNGAFMRPSIPRNLTTPATESKAKKVKYVDDGSIAVSINLNKCLNVDQSDRPRPLTFRERTEHFLPSQNNLLQYYLTEAEEYAFKNKMKINKNKTQVMIFNESRKMDFLPLLEFSGGYLSDQISWTDTVR